MQSFRCVKKTEKTHLLAISPDMSCLTKFQLLTGIIGITDFALYSRDSCTGVLVLVNVIRKILQILKMSEVLITSNMC